MAANFTIDLGSGKERQGWRFQAGQKKIEFMGVVEGKDVSLKS